MRLSIKDRLNFGVLFPQRGDILTQLLVKSISKKIEITPNEVAEIGLKEEGTLLKWDVKKAKDKEIDFSETEINLLKSQVKELNERKEITQQNLQLCLLIQDYKEKPKN